MGLKIDCRTYRSRDKIMIILRYFGTVQVAAFCRTWTEVFTFVDSIGGSIGPVHAPHVTPDAIWVDLAL